MPNFKPKTAKKIIVNEKDTITLDKKHEEICSEFKSKNEDIVPKLRKKKKLLEKKINSNTFTLEQKLQLKDELVKVVNEIKCIKEKEKQYYLNNSEYIFKYFENKKEIEN